MFVLARQSPGRVFGDELITRRFGSLDWCVRAGRLAPEQEGVLQSPDAVLAVAGNLLKSGNSTTVGCACGVAIKRYNFQGARTLIKDLFRKARAVRAFDKAGRLEQAGISTARALAVSAQRRWGLPYRSYLVMEEIPHAVPLHKWRGDRRLGVRRVAELVARLHNAGFSHRDLKQDNLLFDPEGRLFLIDLEGLEYLESVPVEKALANLSRLLRGAEMSPLFNTADKGHFLRHYCRARNLHPRELIGN